MVKTPAKQQPRVELRQVKPAEPGFKLKVPVEAPSMKLVLEELKMLRVAVNMIADHLESKYSPGIFTPEERELMGLPPR